MNNAISLDINELTNKEGSENIPKLLQEKDILSFSRLEEGLNSENNSNNSNNSNNYDGKKNKINPVTILKNYLPEDDDNNYHSEDENLITLTDNIRLKEISVFKKLEYKDVEYKIDKA